MASVPQAIKLETRNQKPEKTRHGHPLSVFSLLLVSSFWFLVLPRGAGRGAELWSGNRHALKKLNEARNHAAQTEAFLAKRSELGLADVPFIEGNVKLRAHFASGTFGYSEQWR